MSRFDLERYWQRRATRLAREAAAMRHDLERVLAELRLARAMAAPEGADHD